jgi:hypothetical protein
MLQQRHGHVAEHGQTMAGGAIQLAIGLTMTHGDSFQSVFLG